MARIYATDGSGDHPVHGAVKEKTESKWEPMSWTLDGIYRQAGNETAFDLIKKECDPNGA